MELSVSLIDKYIARFSFRTDNVSSRHRTFSTSINQRTISSTPSISSRNHISNTLSTNTLVTWGTVLSTRETIASNLSISWCAWAARTSINTLGYDCSSKDSLVILSNSTCWSDVLTSSLTCCTSSWRTSIKYTATTSTWTSDTFFMRSCKICLWNECVCRTLENTGLCSLIIECVRVTLTTLGCILTTCTFRLTAITSLISLIIISSNRTSSHTNSID
mgnify:CR=1 FL=1